MFRHILTLAVAATLFAPLAATAEDTPVTPPAPTAPPVPIAPRPHNHISGKISAVDATAKTITLSHHHKDTTLTLTADAKIYKPGDDKGSPTGTWSDLTVGTMINAKIAGDSTAPTVTEVHIHAPKLASPAAPAQPTAPASPAAPVTPAVP